MRKAMCLAVALAACEGTPASETDGFVPIGGEPDAAAPEADGAPPDPGRRPLKLRFEPIEQDANALRLTDIAFLPGADGEFLVTDKDGELIHMRLEAGRARRLGGFRIDDTWFDSDAGLLSVAVDPGFAENRFFYLGLTPSQETSVVRRYRLDAGDYEATKRSAQPIIEVTGDRAPRSWHNVGSIGFTSEGYLWALFGDKVLGEPAQDRASPLGALLRVVPSRDAETGGYTVPADNPFADGSGHPAVYAKGMRSPWKGLYRDGKWWFGDVGLDTWEELNLIDQAGLDFGWPTAEGVCDCDDFAEPVEVFDHTSRHPFVQADPDATSARLRAIWVGWMYAPREDDPYRGRWDGVLTYGDGYTGFVRAHDTDPQASDDDWHAGHLVMPTGWAQGPDGYVYVTALGTWPIDMPNEVPSPIYRAVLADP